MDNRDRDLNTVKTDIALIKKDVIQIEKIYKKIEVAMDDISGIYKNLAVQETMLQNNEKRITVLEEKIIAHHESEEQFRKELTKTLDETRSNAAKQRDEKHKEILDTIKEVNKEISERMDEQEKKLEEQGDKIEKLEKWRYYILGAIAAILFLFNYFKTTILAFFAG